MNQRVVLCLSTVVLAALATGCSEDLPPGPDNTTLQVTPQFTGVAEGDSIQLTAMIGGEAVEATWETQYDSIATVSSTGMVYAHAGGFTGVTATLASNPARSRSASITVIPIPEVFSGEPVAGISGSGARGSASYYKIDVPAGTTNLTVTLAGGSGDVDLYLQHASRPTYDTADCWSFNGGNGEECSVDDPAAGLWYIMLDLWDPYSGVTLEATLTPAP